MFPNYPNNYNPQNPNGLPPIQQVHPYGFPHSHNINPTINNYVDANNNYQDNMIGQAHPIAFREEEKLQNIHNQNASCYNHLDATSNRLQPAENLYNVPNDVIAPIILPNPSNSVQAQNENSREVQIR